VIGNLIRAAVGRVNKTVVHVLEEVEFAGEWRKLQMGGLTLSWLKTSGGRRTRGWGGVEGVPGRETNAVRSGLGSRDRVWIRCDVRSKSSRPLIAVRRHFERNPLTVRAQSTVSSNANYRQFDRKPRDVSGS
jgi:hypothetical protein